MPASMKTCFAAGASRQSTKLPDSAVDGVQLKPAARKSLLCPCNGEVVEWKGQYGWLQVHGHVDHLTADMHGGHIFIHKADLVRGTTLEAGDHVSFYLYADDKGLGAELCQSLSSARAPPGNWAWPQQTGVEKLQSQTVYCMPLVMVSENIASLPPPVAKHARTDAEKQPVERVNKLSEAPCTPGELPSVGSAGHADGTCKRCAFFPKGRCQNGSNCTHCHYDHTPNKRLRKRKSRRGNTVQEALPDMSDDEDELQVAKTSDSTPLEAESADYDSDTASTQSTDSPQSAKSQKSMASDCDSEDDRAETATTIASDGASDGEESCSRVSCTTPSMSERLVVSPPSSPELASRGCLLEPPSSSELYAANGDGEVKTSVFHQTAHALPVGEMSFIFSPAESPTKADCELAPSPTSWLAQARARRANGVDKSVSLPQLTRLVRSLLNKLSHERFESICGQILALPCSTPEQLAVFATEIFDKATVQDGFRSMYTELCMRLDAHFASQETLVGGKLFRKALANECQTTFERYLQPADAASYIGLDDDEKFEAEMKLKERRLGNMRFIGELIVKGLLAQKLLPRIIYQLVNGDEAALESLIALLMVAAPIFDQEGSIYRAAFIDTFASLLRRRSDKALSQRLKCHLSDLFEARARRWAPRGPSR